MNECHWRASKSSLFLCLSNSCFSQSTSSLSWKYNKLIPVYTFYFMVLSAPKCLAQTSLIQRQAHTLQPHEIFPNHTSPHCLWCLKCKCMVDSHEKATDWSGTPAEPVIKYYTLRNAFSNVGFDFLFFSTKIYSNARNWYGSAYMKSIILHFLILIWFDYVILMNILVKSWEAQGAWYGGKNSEL